MSLEGKIAWVTGAAGGIGAAVVKDLSSRGVVVIGTDRDASDSVEACDASDPDAIAHFAEAIGRRHDRLDILVNNAGVQRRKHLMDFSGVDFDTLFSTNVRGVFFACQAAARLMINKGVRGSIINISSINAERAQPETVLYCATKGAVATMTRALAVAVGKYGIRVNAVAPGTISTGLNRDRLSDVATVEAVTLATPLGRLGMPDDVAPAVAFLASEEAAFVTGASVAVHGGWTLSG